MKTLAKVSLLKVDTVNKNPYSLVIYNSRLYYYGDVAFTAPMESLVFVIMVIHKIITTEHLPVLSVIKPVIQQNKIVFKPLELGDDMVLLVDQNAPIDMLRIPQYYVDNYIKNQNPEIPEIVHVSIDHSFRTPSIGVKAKRIWSYKELQAIVERTALMANMMPVNDVINKVMTVDIYN